MKSTCKNRSEFIDFARGFSILTIVMFHFLLPLELPSFLEKAIRLGGAGVHLFIFISGFGLTLSTSNSLKHFLFKRFKKVLVPYYMIITITFLFSLIVPIFKTNLYEYFGHIFLYKMFDSNIIDSLGVQFWFISTIIQFYLFYPILLKIKNTVGNKKFLILSSITSISWWLFLLKFNLCDNLSYTSFFFQYLWEFSLGMVMAVYFKENKFNFEFKPIYLFITIPISFFIMYFLILKFSYVGKVFNDVFSFTGYTASALLIFYFVKNKQFLSNIFSFVSKHSYSLYLTHMLAFHTYSYFLDIIQRHNYLLYDSALIFGSAIFVSFLYQKVLDKFALC